MAEDSNVRKSVTELAEASKLIGKYELLTRLATGGMAELFLAREQGIAGLERLVVIKRILPHLADQPSFVDMFLREARIAARLSHPNVVQIYDLGQEEESYHIAMEYIHGSTVRELLLLSQEQERQMPVEVVLSIVERACRGLHAAHELTDHEGNILGLVHRDVSPHNLMCTLDGHVKLLDFGVAKTTAAAVEATYSGSLKGKFAYLSPEQCLHEPLDRRSDIFAMGIVLWEMSTMRRLFKRPSEYEIMRAITEEPVPVPGRFRPDFPDAVEAVILRALSKEREERYQTAEQMRLAIAEAAQKEGLVLGEDAVASYLQEVAGETLTERQEMVSKAFERALTATERRRLLHRTGSDSRGGTPAGEDGLTVAERPGSLSIELTQRTPKEELQALVEQDLRAGAEEATASMVERGRILEDQKVGLSGRPLALLVAALTVGAGLALVWAISTLSSGEGQEIISVEHGQEVVLAGEPLRVGWAPTVDPAVLEKELEPLHRYLERRTGRPVPMVMAESYQDLSRRLLAGEVDMAVLPPMLYVETEREEPEVEILAFKEFDGSISSDALLLVRTDDQVRRIDELEGRTFCFVDPKSTSGVFLPRQYIRDHGFDPDEFVGAIRWSGDHFQGMRDLIDGKCDAAATYSGAFLSGDEFGIRTGRIRTLAITGFIPQDSVTAGRHMSVDDRQLMREAFLGFNPSQELGLERMGENQRITGFSPGDRTSFESLRQLLAYQDEAPERDRPEVEPGED